ncbi:MAG: aspartate kinase [Pseudomonadota bacterium]
MAIIVQKFGGTSVSNVAHIKSVAQKVLLTKSLGDSPIVVVSAMAGVTNQLANYCATLSCLTSQESLAEYDVALSSGEIVTSSLLALALQALGTRAMSLTAWQLPINTTGDFSKALINSIDIDYLKSLLTDGITPIIAGFQGASPDGRITTLGRGGSDTTAAALAAAIDADRCDIYTDVDGVFTTDPRLVHNARKISFLSYEEMLEFASSGAKVLHTRSVQIAMKYSIPLRVISSFTEAPSTEALSTEASLTEIMGTTITNRDLIMETPKITGIAYNKNFAAVDIESDVTLILEKLTQSNVHIDSFYRKDPKTTTLLIPLEDISKTKLAIKDEKYSISTDIAILSVVGFGIKNTPEILRDVCFSLKQHNISIMMMTSSEIKISLMLPEKDLEQAVKILHEALGLGEEA